MLTIRQIEDLEAAGVEPWERASRQQLTPFRFLSNLSNHSNAPVHTRITHADTPVRRKRSTNTVMTSGLSTHTMAVGSDRDQADGCGPKVAAQRVGVN